MTYVEIIGYASNLYQEPSPFTRSFDNGYNSGMVDLITLAFGERPSKVERDMEEACQTQVQWTNRDETKNS